MTTTEVDSRSRLPIRLPQPSIDRKYLQDGECTLNAGIVADDNGWTYVEGFAQAPDYPGEWIEHAWCVDADGFVVDPTWTDVDARFVYVEAADLDPFGRS